MPRFKLQIRIILLISGLSLLLLSVFTYIQLQNQFNKLLSQNKLRARVGTILVKTSLEMLLKDIQVEEALPSMFEAAISSFAKQGMVEKVSVMTLEGKPIATNDPLVKMFGEMSNDIETYIELSKASGKNAWFYSTLNQKTKTIDIYIPITIGGVTYITKLSFSIERNIRQAVIEIMVPVGLTGLAVVLINILLGFILLKTVVSPIKQLNEATKDIASGHLNRRVDIRTHDEIEELGHTFNTMTVALKRMKEIAENANPLTGLPGNNVIREEVESRIAKKETFVVIHSDLDNFKAYNDRYGISRGDDVIKFTCEVIKNALKKHGNNNDFLGHEGGDDYFLITTPDKCFSIADSIIKEFDSKVESFYNDEDREKGHIISKDRQGQTLEFPIMSISLAGVSNANRVIANYGELTNIAVGVKKKAKDKKKSVFCLDERKE